MKSELFFKILKAKVMVDNKKNVFEIGDKVKVISDAVKGWDRNPVHEIYAIGFDDDKTIFFCLRTDTPVYGDIETGKRTNSYMSGVFYTGEFKKV